MSPVQNLEELIQTLEQHPEWQERLLKVLLTGEFRRLPDRMDRLESVVAQLAEQVQALAEGQRQLQVQVQALAEGQRQLQVQMQALAERVQTLAENQQQLQVQVQALAENQQELRVQVQALAENQRQLQVQVQALTQQVQALAEGQQRLWIQVQALTVQVDKMAALQQGMLDDLGYLKGRDRERFYREHASAVFGRYLRKVKVMDKGELLEQLNTTKALADEEWDAIVALDLALEAVTRQTARPIVLAMEVSWIIDPGDVERAVHRAAIMQERGLPAIPVVGGKGLLPDAKDDAQLHRVLIILDGRILSKEFLE